MSNHPLDTITQAEKEAEKTVLAAREKAQKIVSKAQTQAADAREKAAASYEEKKEKAIKKALSDAESLSDSLAFEMKSETKDIETRVASSHDDAVAHVVSRMTENISGN